MEYVNTFNVNQTLNNWKNVKMVIHIKLNSSYLGTPTAMFLPHQNIATIFMFGLYWSDCCDSINRWHWRPAKTLIYTKQSISQSINHVQFLLVDFQMHKYGTVTDITWSISPQATLLKSISYFFVNNPICSTDVAKSVIS